MIARQAIGDALARYAHGVDRCDPEVFGSAFWPDARIDYGDLFAGTPAQFIEIVFPRLRAMRATMHFLGNVLIEFQSQAEARSEAYVIGFHDHDPPPPEKPFVRVLAGRYLDRFVLRQGAWRIADRVFVLDRNENAPCSAIWLEPPYSLLNRVGRRTPDDAWDQDLPAGR